MSQSSALVDRNRSRTRAFDAIVARIREDIFHHRLAAGDRLPSEDALADRFGVSRTVVREALRVLELQGLVVVRHGYGGGAFVAEASPTPVSTALETMLRLEMVEPAELHEARLILEPAIARTAAARLDTAHLLQLEENIALAETAAASPDGAFKYNLEFHSRLAASSRNPVFSLVMQAVIDSLVRLDYRVAIDPMTGRQIVSEHRTILEALRQGQGDLAADRMVAHLQRLAPLEQPRTEWGEHPVQPAALAAADTPPAGQVWESPALFTSERR